jgi:hypothetical protein
VDVVPPVRVEERSVVDVVSPARIDSCGSVDNSNVGDDNSDDAMIILYAPPQREQPEASVPKVCFVFVLTKCVYAVADCQRATVC